MTLFVTYFPSSVLSLSSLQQINIQNTQGLEQLTDSGGPFHLITGKSAHKVVLKPVLCLMTSEKRWNLQPPFFDFCFADINHSFAIQFIEVTMLPSAINN